MTRYRRAPYLPRTRPRPRPAPARGALAAAAGLAAIAGPAACGGEGDERGAPPASALELETEAGGEIVARASGEPISARCVRAQARAAGGDRREALQRCIDFALLAREAEERTDASRPGVKDHYRRELARALIREEFERDLAAPEDIPHEELEEIWPRARREFDREERREIYYVRAPLPDDADEGGEADRRARDLAREIADELGGYTNLEGDRLVELAAEIADDRALERGRSVFTRDDVSVHEDFRRAAFAVPEERGLSDPVRTEEGWDVILVTNIEPETRKDFDAALPALRELVFEDYRRSAFLEWTEGIRRELEVELFPENLELLAGTAPPGAGGRR